MPLIEWKDEYSVKVKVFDEHHKQLVNIINQLDQSIQEKKTQRELNIIFSKLIEYTQIHFDSEETLLRQNNYPDVKAQEEEHANFVAKLKDMCSAFKSQEPDIEQQVLSFLKNWLVHHILDSDQAYSDFLNDKGIS